MFKILRFYFFRANPGLYVLFINVNTTVKLNYSLIAQLIYSQFLLSAASFSSKGQDMITQLVILTYQIFKLKAPPKKHDINKIFFYTC